MQVYDAKTAVKPNVALKCFKYDCALVHPPNHTPNPAHWARVWLCWGSSSFAAVHGKFQKKVKHDWQDTETFAHYRSTLKCIKKWVDHIWQPGTVQFETRTFYFRIRRIDRNVTSSNQRLTLDVYFRELNRLVEVSQRRSSLEPGVSSICPRLQKHAKALALTYRHHLKRLE